MKTKQIKTITLCCRRVCGVWLWANETVEKQHFCWIFFFSQVGWTIQNCQFLVRVCFNQNTEFWEKVSKNNCRKGWLWICLKLKMKYNKNKFHRVVDWRVGKRSNLTFQRAYWVQFLRISRRCAWPETTVSRAKESHDIWRSLASEAEQV